jgi:hypothetical protein
MDPPIRASYISMIAAMHLREMEREGTLSSLPDELIAIVPRLTDDNIRHSVFLMTIILAVRLDDIEQRRGFFLSFLDDPDFRIRLKSAVMLSRVDASLTNGVPILLQAVTNNSFMASTFPAIAGLPQLPNQARIEQRTAHEALNKVAPELAEQHPVPD